MQVHWIRCTLSLLLLAAGLFAWPAAGQRPEHLTPPSQRDAAEIARNYLHEHASEMGLEAQDIADLHVTDRYVTRRTGTTHVYLRQRLDGIEVHGAEVGMAIDRDGRLLPMRDRLVRGLHGSMPARGIRLDAEEAILAAAQHLSITPQGSPGVRRVTPGPAGEAVHAAAGISRDEIPVKRAYIVDENGLARLCWSVVIRTPDGRHWWNIFVDAIRGDVLRQDDWIANDTYRVHSLPQESPNSGPRALLADPVDNLASPFGWHDTDGVEGAEFTDTQGNNVVAQDDIDADDLGGVRPDGGAGLDFDFPLDLTMQPNNYLEASVAQLFYVSNVVHDVMYQYGFDEAAGNFQHNNYGAGGIGGDPVQADSLDGSGVDNAQFGTPPDGMNPRMEMFRWNQSPAPRFVVHTPVAIARTYYASPAKFGGGTPALAGMLVQALDPADGVGPTTTDACSPLTNPGAVAGNLVLIDRGTCSFVIKVANAQEAGATGVIIANNDGEELIDMAGVDPSLTIPAIFIGQAVGATLAGQLGTGVTGNLISAAARDSSLDAGVVVHEYGHGITNRLTGGPSNVSCLDAAESAGMGEGWSDWFGLLMTALPSDESTDSRGVAAYLRGQPPGGRGIRNNPYSTDLSMSPFTYADIADLNQPHGVGEVWAAALWEMYWNFVDLYGFDTDLYTGTGGNNRALQLVIDALKLQPCDPTFVEGRDALLTADLNANAGVNECLIWDAYAKRGVGLTASDGGGSDTLAVTEAFDVPVTCLPEPRAMTMLAAGGLLLLQLRRRVERRH